MTRELCVCGKIAVWCYTPGFSDGDSPYFCDDCVPRGCECNHIYSRGNNPLSSSGTLLHLHDGIENVEWKWIDKGSVWVYLDEKMREYPCSEFIHEKEGYEREINPHII